MFHGRFYILTSGRKKIYVQFEIDFMLNFAMCSAGVTCVNVSTI